MSLKRGGTVKLLRDAVAKEEQDKVAMAQYHSLERFADMMADPVYEAADLRYRLPGYLHFDDDGGLPSLGCGSKFKVA